VLGLSLPPASFRLSQGPIVNLDKTRFGAASACQRGPNVCIALVAFKLISPDRHSPSAIISCPVIALAASLTRNAMTLATSYGCMKRFIGI
jgi:hypothetical protein